MLEKTRTILVKPSGFTKGVDAGQVYFCAEASEEGDDHRSTELQLDKSVWEEMESPDTITVTIEPGDKLNNPIEQQWGGDIKNRDTKGA